MASVQTQLPAKGDLVVGHHVLVFTKGNPVVGGKVVDVSTTGHRVKVSFGGVLGALGLKSRWFSWRRSTETYQCEHSKTDKYACVALRKGKLSLSTHTDKGA